MRRFSSEFDPAVLFSVALLAFTGCGQTPEQKFMTITDKVEFALAGENSPYERDYHPRLFQKDIVETNSRLKPLAGTYTVIFYSKTTPESPSLERKVTFHYEYDAEDGRWRLDWPNTTVTGNGRHLPIPEEIDDLFWPPYQPVAFRAGQSKPSVRLLARGAC